MAVDATAVARVLGISSTFKDMRIGSVSILPQRIAVFAQGASDSVYSLTPWQVTSAADAGARYGYGSPIHLICTMLLPANGDGVGTIPVVIFPMEDAGGGSAPSVGQIAVSGTQTDAAQYRVTVSNIKGKAFAIAASATDATKYRAIVDSLTPVVSMPVNATYVYGTVTAADGSPSVGNGTCTVLSAPGQPIPGVWTLENTSAVVNGGVWKLTDPDGNVTDTGLTQTVGAGAATAFVTSAGLNFTITDGSTDFSLGDKFLITVPVSHIALTSKWEGVSANAIKISIEDGDGGTVFATTQPTGGLVNPTVDAALAQIVNIWYTMGLNALNDNDTTALDTIQTFGEGRWGALVRKPMVVFRGNVATTLASATSVTEDRTDDRVNSQLVNPGSNDLPFMVAARQLARIATMAQNSPPSDYGALRATGLTPGADSVQWTYPVRDAAVKAGSSTIETVDSVVTIGDVVTHYNNNGEVPPAYRYVCDIVKLQQVYYNLNLRFATNDWVGAPLVPDDQEVDEPRAKKPKDAVAVIASLIDALGRAAIISDPATAKKTIVVNIDTDNPKRLNGSFDIQLSGNTNIINIDFTFGFFYPSVAA